MSNSTKITAYRGNRVSVHASSVVLDGKELLGYASPAELAWERAFLVAGNGE